MFKEDLLREWGVTGAVHCTLYIPGVHTDKEQTISHCHGQVQQHRTVAGEHVETDHLGDGLGHSVHQCDGAVHDRLCGEDYGHTCDACHPGENVKLPLLELVGLKESLRMMR